MAWRAGGVVAAIALSSCIGTGVAFADDVVIDAVDQQPQIVLAEDVQSDRNDSVGSSDSNGEEATACEAAVGAETATEESGNSGDVAIDQQESSQQDASTSEQSNEVAENDAASETSAQAAVASATAADPLEKVSDSNRYEAPDSQEYSAFDLRHYGGDISYNDGDLQSTITGGISYVTPVKLQNPWGTCWAFASTAASETSLLTELDKADDGQLNGSISSTVALAWAKEDWADDNELNGSIDYGTTTSRIGLLAEYASDLSERHLAWFAYYDVTADSVYPEQEGEGLYRLNGSTDAESIFNSGGWAWLSLSEYSSGMGPVPEYVAPYINDEGYYEVLDEVQTGTGFNFDLKVFSSYQEALEYATTTWTEEAKDAFRKARNYDFPDSRFMPKKSKSGTWSLDDDQAFMVFAELCNSNVLDQDLSTRGLSSQEIDLMKSELMEGHAISIAYRSDQSVPGQILGGNTYLNTETWAQYTYQNVSANHAVTVVGYDDNYAASNFTHTIYKTDEKGKVVYDADGNPVVDEEKTALTTPAGNGAWIVKNSWGYIDAEDAADRINWGINGSGYFYLSYYDKTITSMESYEFDVSEEAQSRLGYLAYQHDLANVKGYETVTPDTLFKMCNVFDGPEQGEGSISIRDLGFVTGTSGDTVTLEVYVMDDAADVEWTIDTSAPVAKVSATFDCSGYHRIHLDSALKVLPDQKFAVVQTTVRSDGSYEYNLMKGYSKEYAEAYTAYIAPIDNRGLPYYTETVINKGESLTWTNGVWGDLIELASNFDQNAVVNEIADIRANAARYQKQADAATDPEKKAQYLQMVQNSLNFTTNSLYAIDNWCIKVYADATGIDISKAISTATEKVFTYDGDTHSPHVLVTMGGTVLVEGVDYLLSGEIENSEIGVYQIIVNGIGEYIGSTTFTWRIITPEAPDPVPDSEEGDDNADAISAEIASTEVCIERTSSFSGSPKTADPVREVTPAAAGGLLGAYALACAALKRKRNNG